MLDFHVPTLADKKWIDEIFEGTEYFGCFCTFATLWLWKDRYFTEVARFGNAMLIRGADDQKNIYYMYPMGKEYDIRSTAHSEQTLIDMRSEGNKPKAKTPKPIEPNTSSSDNSRMSQKSP